MNVLDLSSISSVDIITICIILGVGIFSMFRGFFIEGIRFFVYGLCFLLTMYLYEPLASMFFEKISIIPYDLLRPIIFSMLFFGIFFIGIICIALSSVITWVDKEKRGKIFAFLLGMIRGGLLAVLIFTSLSLYQVGYFVQSMRSSYTCSIVFPSVEYALQHVDRMLVHFSVPVQRTSLLAIVPIGVKRNSQTVVKINTIEDLKKLFSQGISGVKDYKKKLQQTIAGS